MRVVLTRRFARDYRQLSSDHQEKVDELLKTLPQEIEKRQHPGMRIKKMANQPNIFEARVDIHYRMTFNKERDILIMRRVGTHKIYRKP